VQRLSADTQQLIRALQESPSLTDRPLGRQPDRSDIIGCIEAAGEHLAVAYPSERAQPPAARQSLGLSPNPAAGGSRSRS
jgi:hypothetical protein